MVAVGAIYLNNQLELTINAPMIAISTLTKIRLTHPILVLP
jgi:hypothetical protein